MVQGALNFCSRCTDDDDDDDDDLVAETDGPGAGDVANMKGYHVTSMPKSVCETSFFHLRHVIIASTSHS